MEHAQVEANTLLTRANEEDNYITLCKRCELNTRARNGLRDYFAWHDQSLAAEVEKSLSGRAKVIIMNPNAEGGMPHTRALNLICIPANYPQSRLPQLLVHEYLHVHQRSHFSQWRDRLLKEGWFPDGQVPEEIQRRCRINPDTLVCRWPAWEGRWIPCPVYVREDKPSLRDIEIRWWDTKEQRLIPWAPSSYIRKYGQVSRSEMEHPFELWAYKEEGK